MVDARASLTKYHQNGEKLTTQTVEYPAGTIVIDVVDATSRPGVLVRLEIPR